VSCVCAEGNVKRVLFVNLERDKCVIECLEEISRKEKIKAGAFNLIGALKSVNMKYYDQRTHGYRDVSKEEPMEIVSCMGDISVKENGEVMIHAHIALADSKGRVWGGHLDRGSCVGAVAEATIFEFGMMKLKRKFNPETNLYHISPETAHLTSLKARLSTERDHTPFSEYSLS
jgi:predicted DNA-binding protein with PD1-like motif